MSRPSSAPLSWPIGGGETARRICAHDWSASPLGPVEGWPASLRTAASLILESPFPSVVLWGEEFIVAAYNDAYRKVLKGKPEALGRPLLEVWAEVAGALAPQLRRALAGESVLIEGAGYTLDRGARPEEAWFDYAFSPVRDDAGRVLGVLNIGVETTTRVRAETAHRESEERWRDVFERMGEGFEVNEMILGPEGRAVDFVYVDVNAAWERQSGFSRELVVGRRATEVFPREETDYWVPLFGGVAETGEAVTVQRYFPPARRWLEVIVYRLSLGRVAVLVRDVSERHRAAAMLQASETRLRVATEANGIGTWELILHEDGTTSALTSRRHDAIFGYDEPVTAWDASVFLSHVAPEHRDEVAQRLQEAIDACDTWTFEVLIRTRDGGGPRWIEAHGQPVERDGAGRPKRFVGVVQDITRRKVAEERQALLAREVDHRAKNALFVVLAAMRLTRATDMSSYIAAVEGRVSALARAQTLLAERRWSGADFAGLIAGELSPFLGERRAELDGPVVTLPAGMAQPIAMVLHELATNAVKHGALSVATGRLSVSWQLEEGQGRKRLLRLRWVETGGPLIRDSPRRSGFGSRLLDATVRGQLGGRMTIAWEERGLTCAIDAPLTGDGADPGASDIAPPL